MFSRLGTPRGCWLAVGVLYVGMTLAYAWPLLPVIGSALPNDTGDPGLNTWILWWNAHAVPLTTKWWNGPIFFPARGATALSETFLNLVPLSTPLQWAGASAVLTSNLMFLLSFPAAALAAHALARRLTGRHDAAFIAGLAFGFAPYRASQISHLQALWSCWMPLGLFALHRFLEERRRRDLALFGACWLMNGFASGYYLMFFSVLLTAWTLWFARSRREWISVATTVVLASLLLAPLLIGYQEYQSTFGVSRDDHEIEVFSADLTAIWAAMPSVWPSRWTHSPRSEGWPEGALYPGAVILALVLVGGIIVRRRVPFDRRYRARPWLFIAAAMLGLVSYHAWSTGGWTFRLAGVGVSLTHPAKTAFLAVCVAVVAVWWDPRLVDAWRRRSAFLFYTAAAALMLLFALGPQARVLGTTFLSQAPYYFLMRLPGGHAFRVPARFGMLFVLCLGVAAAVAFRRLTPRGSRPLLAAVVCLAVAFEGFMSDFRVVKVPPALDLAGLDRGAVVLELPLIPRPDVEAYPDSEAMLRATRVGYTLVNGRSGYDPPHYPILKQGLADLDESVLRALQRFGSLFVFVHEDTGRGETYRDWIAELPDAHRVIKAAEGVLFQLPARAPQVQRPFHQVPIASIHTELDSVHVGALTDGDLGTRWQTVRHQAAGDELRISFERPATVSRLEMDLGSFADDYPRKLRISAVGDDPQPKVVWEGGAYGSAMLAALTDRHRMPLCFDFTPQVRLRELILTLLDGQPDLAWSIAELRVFGE